MELKYELGDPARPKGHALVYFTDAGDSERTLATYVILLPVLVDIKKYVPPFLAGQVEAMKASDLSAFAFPPAPEPVESAAWVRRAAESRGDDLFYGGTASSRDPADMLGKVGELVTEYARQYSASWQDAQQPTARPAAGEQVEDVVYGLMGEADLLTELTALIGRLRYSAEGGDAVTRADAEAKVSAISRRLPENRRVAKLLEAAGDTTARGGELAQLYLERAYCLYREEYLRVKALDEKIAALEDT
jgi:hypothetical protein